MQVSFGTTPTKKRPRATKQPTGGRRNRRHKSNPSLLTRLDVNVCLIGFDRYDSKGQAGPQASRQWDAPGHPKRETQGGIIGN